MPCRCWMPCRPLSSVHSETSWARAAATLRPWDMSFLEIWGFDRYDIVQYLAQLIPLLRFLINLPHADCHAILSYFYFAPGKRRNEFWILFSPYPSWLAGWHRHQTTISTRFILHLDRGLLLASWMRIGIGYFSGDVLCHLQNLAMQLFMLWLETRGPSESAEPRWKIKNCVNHV